MKELSLHILDLVENALRAGARRVVISVREDSQRDLLEITIEDDGVGMDEETKRRALDPFFSTKGKKIGIGLPLVAQLSAQCGGHLEISSEKGRGTRVKVTFQKSHIDLPPLGNLPETLFVLLASHPEVEFVFSHEIDGRSWSFNSREIFEELGVKSLEGNSMLIASLRDWIAYQENLLREGKGSENYKH
ncbi:MAG: ATP-binding protein [Candidatus Caldatribacterium sp.]|nr:ATP-binding protein [Candidatus Caldatribacterium sp.]